jgi:4-phospho-D-threonate 3-dehydrogenase / 4-phospho-D-erythronate 3-dehydrogenase
LSMKKNRIPIIAITPGDPCGVGPEIVIKSLVKNPDLARICHPVVIGSSDVMEKAMQVLQIKHKINAIKSIDQISMSTDHINCFETNVQTDSPVFGQASAAGGAHAYASIETAIKLAMEKKVDAIATAPINKVALKKADVAYLDHTEILTKLTDSTDTMTLFVTGDLRVFFYSRHIQFKDISDSLNIPDLVHSLSNCITYLKVMGIETPSLALAALNPHGSENGMFGNEETDILEPSVVKAREMGLNAHGPVPADSVFHLAKDGHYDAVLSLYHDQGHIATKTLDFYRTVALTMGLPFLRTSVDHGTAFDIAGKGEASEISMVEAIKSAAKYWW